MKRLRASVVAVLMSMLSCSHESRPVERIVLITIDTLRYDAFRDDLMPETTAFAKHGVRFTRFYSATSSTQPTHATLFTGLHPWQHGVSRNGLVLGPAYTTVTEQLADAGWTTTAIVASFPLEERFGFAQGFATYDDDFTERMTQEWIGEAVDDGRFYALSNSVVDRAVVSLDAAEGSHQFFWFHFFDPHEPYGDAAKRDTLKITALLRAYRKDQPGAPQLLKRARSLYAADVAVLDQALARLFTRLDDDEDITTHIVVTVDHGESFGEGGAIGHGQHLTPEQIHVPSFMVSPRIVPKISDDIAGTSDVTATLLSLAGLPHHQLPGRDLLLPPPATPMAFGMRRTYAEPFDEVKTDGSTDVLVDPMFYVALSQFLVTGRADGVTRDDNPAHPLGPGQSEQYKKMFATFEDELSTAHSDEPLDATTREALEALGYVR